MGPSVFKGQNSSSFHALKGELEHCLLQHGYVHMSVVEAFRLSIRSCRAKRATLPGAAKVEAMRRQRAIEGHQNPQRLWDVRSILVSQTSDKHLSTYRVPETIPGLRTQR